MTEEELAAKIKAKVEEVNKLLLEAYNMGLEVKISEDEQSSKTEEQPGSLAFRRLRGGVNAMVPALRISLSNTIQYILK